MDKLLSPKETMTKLLGSMSQLGASDLHVKSGYAPYYRVAGHLRRVEMPSIPNSAFIEEMLAEMIPAGRRPEFDARGSLDFSAASTGSTDRFRVNLFRSMGDTHAAIRRVQSKIPTFEELHLPPVYRDSIASSLEGLILVSGVTGSGKSSTLAAMLQHLNEIRSMHIITVEDPVEYVFQPKKSIISQREIGIDMPDYAEALRFVVRQDPDCILIGEMRDKETMLAALQSAETGHLVLGSIHCSDAQQTFSRILEFFPRAEHAFIRATLANSLSAILCQRLLPGIDSNSRFPATEVLLNNAVVKDKILHEQDEDIPAIIAQSREEGMRTFTDSLCELIESEVVHYDTAMEHAPSREALSSMVKGIKTASHSILTRLRAPK